jgi:hypothetical protein
MLAAATKWYDFYYDVVLKGQYTFHIQELHKRYGPIIRVTPEEVHVRAALLVDVYADPYRYKTPTSSRSSSQVWQARQAWLLLQSFRHRQCFLHHV